MSADPLALKNASPALRLWRSKKTWRHRGRPTCVYLSDPPSHSSNIGIRLPIGAVCRLCFPTLLTRLLSLALLLLRHISAGGAKALLEPPVIKHEGLVPWWRYRDKKESVGVESWRPPDVEDGMTEGMTGIVLHAPSLRHLRHVVRR